MFTTSYKLSIIATALVASTLNAGQVGALTTFQANTTAKASEVNNNFIVLTDAINDNDTRINTKQDRVSGACGAGFYMQSVNVDGSVVCQQDIDTNSGGDITGVTAGYGLTGGGSTGAVTVNADTNVLQERVTGYCNAGYSIRQIYSNGTVVCEQDTVGSGDITSVTAAGGLTGGGTSGDVTVKRASGGVTINGLSLISSNRGSCVMTGNYDYTYFDPNKTTSDSCIGYASLNLPNGATITNLTCKIYSNDDTSTDSLYVGLLQFNLNGGAPVVMASIDTSIDSNNYQTISDTTITYPVIDNGVFIYALKYDPPNTTSTASYKNRFYFCRINYTY